MTGIKLCIVEDEPETRDYLGLYLPDTPGIVCKGSYASGEEALQHISAENCDIVLMDIGLPGMNGIETMLRIRQSYPEIAFIMFTVFEDDEHLFEALKAGADGYLLKKDTLDKIALAILELQEGGSPMSRSIARKVLSHFRATPRNKALDVLSKREMEVLESLSRGLQYKEVAQTLFISEGTVKQHVNHIYTKLHVQNRTEAINKYLGLN